jgi:hypothetical protein
MAGEVRRRERHELAALLIILRKSVRGYLRLVRSVRDAPGLYPPPPHPPIIIVINSHDVICINKLGWFGTGKWACRCPNLRERRFVKVAEGGFSAVMEPSLETGGVLDTPLWGMMAEFGAGVCEVHTERL